MDTSQGSGSGVGGGGSGGGGGGGGRQRHAPLYGRFVVEEELPPTHRDVMHHVSISLIQAHSCFSSY